MKPGPSDTEGFSMNLSMNLAWSVGVLRTRCCQRRGWELMRLMTYSFSSPGMGDLALDDIRFVILCLLLSKTALRYK